MISTPFAVHFISDELRVHPGRVCPVKYAT